MLEGVGGLLMTPVYDVVSFTLVALHWFFSLFLDPAGGASWALSIIGMTILLMAAMTPLVAGQIRCWRQLTLGHAGEIDLSALVLPVLLQLLVLLALFRLLDHAANAGMPTGVLSDGQALQLGTVAQAAVLAVGAVAFPVGVLLCWTT